MKFVKGIYLPDSDTHFEKLISIDGSYQKKQFDALTFYGHLTYFLQEIQRMFRYLVLLLLQPF